jgi:hypothetical protein
MPIFESTLPFGEPDLMRASAFRVYLDELERDCEADGRPGHSKLSSLSPSLMQDLLRFEQPGRQTEILEVVAACLRHARPVCVPLQSGDKVVPLTLFPLQRLAHAPVPLPAFIAGPVHELSVLHVEPALLRPPGDPETGLVGERQLYHALAPVTWELAMRGARQELLPEIAGPAAYRIVPGLNLRQLPLPPELMPTVRRLQRTTSSLREIADWPAMGRARATRLLNALYLQAGLIIRRTHPAATSEPWFGSR